MGNPLIPPPFLKTKLLSQRAVAIIFIERKLLQAITTPFSHHFPWKFNFWLFLAIYHHFCLCMGDPLILPPLSLTKMLSPGAVVMITMERKLLQAITTPFSHHLPENSIFGHFWPFFTICAYAYVTPWSHLRFYWHNYYHWVLLQWYVYRESCSWLLPPHFPAISLKIEFLAIFHHLCLLMGDPMTPYLLLLTKMLSIILMIWPQP